MASRSFRKLSVLAVAIIAPTCAVFLTGCEPECVDRYDCRDRTDDEGHEFVCQDGKCVVDAHEHDEDGGETADAGETDAGETDAGQTDAGETDGGQTTDGGTDGGQGTDGGTGDGGVFNTFHARMTGEQVVPPNATAAGTAIGVFAYNTIARADGGHEFNYNITWTGLANNEIDATHLHVAPGGVNNSAIALTLAAIANNAVSGTATISPALAADIEAGRTYVDVHTQAGPNLNGGTVRGQIIKPGERLFIARLNGAQAGNTTFLCVNQDFPADGTTNYCGGVQVLLSADQQNLRYTGRWDPSVVATASHIHVGGVGQNGGVTVGFNLLADGGSGVEGGPTGLNGTDAGALDGGYYVNVHTADAGAGLIRGQLYER